MEDLTGRTFGAYQIVAPLGEGGMAAVYKAYQPAMERYVAVKVLPQHMASSEEFVLRFRREAKLLAQLQHPHILPVFDYGEADGYPYIVMPLVQGGTLTDLLKKRALSLGETRRLSLQIGDALSYAHERGMIHRDIKPSNILIDERGNCLLTDFGLARMVEGATHLTESGTIMGTPAYMSPEQGAGSPIDMRSDIYSLGIVLYEMVTGRVPYVAETPVAVVFKHIQDPLPSARKFNPSLPQEVELILLKALAKSPNDRYQTAAAFVQAIRRAIPDEDAPDISEQLAKELPAAYAPTVPPQPMAASAASQPAGSKGLRLGLASLLTCGVLGAIALAAIAFMAMDRSNSDTPPPATAAISTATIPASPTDTRVPVASATTAPPVEVSSTVESFRDEFEGQLADGWTWLYEDSSKWSLSAVEGSLQIMVSDASIDGPFPPLNILLRDVPTGDFEITTSLRFTPTTNFQFAGFIVFQDTKNVLQFGRAFCDVVNACVGDGIYFDTFQDGSIAGSNYATPFSGDPIYLRLERKGNTYTGYYSEDGQNWTMTGSHTRELTQAKMGLLAAQSSTSIPAVFDYFTLKKLEP